MEPKGVKHQGKTVTEDIVAELATIARRNKHELVQRKAVVRFARTNPKSAIGRWFERQHAWDDSKMAEQRRLELAGELIKIYFVELPDEVATEKYSGPVRGLMHLPSDREHGGGVRFVRSILENDKRRQEMIDMALSELESVKRKYGALSALAAIWEAIDTARKNAIFPSAAKLAS